MTVPSGVSVLAALFALFNYILVEMWGGSVELREMEASVSVLVCAGIFAFALPSGRHLWRLRWRGKDEGGNGESGEAY